METDILKLMDFFSSSEHLARSFKAEDERDIKGLFYNIASH